MLVLGVGVAGLQALATAKRLGGRTTGYDVRPEVADQVRSVGAQWLDLGIEAAGEGGYARELTEEERAQQQKKLEEAITGFDVVITTALVPGRPAPRLVTAAAVEGMKPGSVVVDLAGETGGNCELTEPGQTVVRHDVTIASPLNLPATMPEHASELYSKNITALLDLLINDGKLAPDFDDEVVADVLRHRTGARETERDMYDQLLANLAILVLSGFVGFSVISKVPNTLHTPLMSGTNAIHGIVLIGALVVLGTVEHPLACRADHPVRRGGVRNAQRRRRLRGHRPDAGHVQGQEARPRLEPPRRMGKRDELSRRPSLPRRVRDVHLRPDGSDRAEDRGAGQLDRRRRYGRRGDRNADRDPPHRELAADHRRPAGRCGAGRAACPARQDDRDAAAGGASTTASAVARSR